MLLSAPPNDDTAPPTPRGRALTPTPSPSLPSLISKRRLCHNVSLWLFNFIVTIDCLWVAKGTISCSYIINSKSYWDLPMKDICILSLFVCHSACNLLPLCPSVFLLFKTLQKSVGRSLASSSVVKVVEHPKRWQEPADCKQSGK